MEKNDMVDVVLKQMDISYMHLEMKKSLQVRKIYFYFLYRVFVFMVSLFMRTYVLFVYAFSLFLHAIFIFIRMKLTRRIYIAETSKDI